MQTGPNSGKCGLQEGRRNEQKRALQVLAVTIGQTDWFQHSQLETEKAVHC